MYDALKINFELDIEILILKVSVFNNFLFTFFSPCSEQGGKNKEERRQ